MNMLMLIIPNRMLLCIWINCHYGGLFIYLQSLLKLNQKVNMKKMKSLFQREINLAPKVRIDDILGYITVLIK